MNRILIWALPVLIFLIFPLSNSEDENVRRSLVQFMEKLSGGNVQTDRIRGWNDSSDPCSDLWSGVACDNETQAVKKIILDKFNFTGTFDATSVCSAKSLAVLSLNQNNISGVIPEEIGNCQRLTHFYIMKNKFSGDIPDSLSQLRNLKRLEISNNELSGQVSGLSRISGLLSFLAENNQLSGEIPGFDSSKLEEFNVSNNNFSGEIPDSIGSKFTINSFLGNPELCGNPLLNACPPSAPPPVKPKSKNSSRNGILMYSGYILLALVVIVLIALIFISKKKSKKAKNDPREVAADTSSSKPSGTSAESKTSRNRSEYSITSAENGTSSSSLVVLATPHPLVKDLKFEDLLRAPAELLGKGKHGSAYKVSLNDGFTLAVKRIKDCDISIDEFKGRLERIHQVKHPRLLSPVAFYCSRQEKLLVYEFQPNGSLFKLLHGSQNGQVFDWGSRLNVAATIAEALAFIHQEFSEDGISHGNLKSTNILFSENMEPCISEYGLMVVENQDQPLPSKSSPSRENNYSTLFKLDIYAFGVILLELLTGKIVQNNEFDLAKWVHSVVREEWTVEVFDKTLISEGASEERMVNLLQVALQCINTSPNDRPTISQIAIMINAIKEDDDGSIISSLDQLSMP